VITLATKKGGASFTILDDADASKFTLEEGNKLTVASVITLSVFSGV
jgi:hypothetical protein